jgi:hypothetical protein
VQGRPIGDTSAKARGCCALNSKEAKLASDKLYGRIEHPTLQDLVSQIIEHYDEARVLDPTVHWSELVMFKMDLAGAYTLISFDPDDVPLMGFELTEERVIFFLCGIFGWSGTPAAFQVVTRACLFELRKLVVGRVCMYVDDVICICLLRNLDRNF